MPIELPTTARAALLGLILVSLSLVGLSSTSSSAPAPNANTLASQIRRHVADSRCSEIGVALATDYTNLRVMVHSGAAPDPLLARDHINVATVLAHCMKMAAAKPRATNKIAYQGITSTNIGEIDNQRALNTVLDVLDRAAIADLESLDPADVEGLRLALRQLQILSASRTFGLLGPEHTEGFRRLREADPSTLDAQDKSRLELYRVWYDGSFISEQNR